MEQIHTDHSKVNVEQKKKDYYNTELNEDNNLSNKLENNGNFDYSSLIANKNKFMRKNIKSRLLNEEELYSFRTIICNDHLNSKCLDPESCFFSHCSAWQRRNPSKYKYSAVICPNIDFLRKGKKGRMSLSCKCKKGRLCEFAHTKEEELYHPDSYKKKKCNLFPHCKRYYCPFIHDDELLLINKSVPQNSPLKETNLLDTGECSFDENDNLKYIFQDIPTSVIDYRKINFDENKQELLMMLVNSQKLILEGNYISAGKIVEKILNSISKMSEYEEFSNLISLNMWPDTFYYTGYLSKPDSNSKRFYNEIGHYNYFR